MGGGRYNRSGCLDHFNVLINANPDYMSQNPAYFFSGSTKYPQLTLHGCQELCGPRWGPYPDNGVRMYSWIIPLILLLANISYPAAGIGKKRFYLILRILGDPISTLFTHLMILEMWVWSSREASKILSGWKADQSKKRDAQNAATEILFAKARYSRSASLDRAVDESLPSLSDERLPLQKRESLYRTLLETGAILSGARVIDIRRSVFAIAVYIVSVVSVFVPAIGGSPSPSGGRVSPAQLLTFLLPLVLINNAVGDFTSWKTVEDILALAFPLKGEVGSGNDSDIAVAGHDSDMVARAVIGPWHPQRAPCARDRRRYKMRRIWLAMVSSFPVLSSFTIATAVDITPPTGASCRAIFNMVAATSWFFSAIITAYLVSRRESFGKWFSTLVLLKDFCIGIPVFVVVTASTCGLFNSCFCSSGVLWRGWRKARVDLEPEWAYAHNKKVYVSSVTVGLSFQIFFFAMVVYKYRRVFALLWKDREAVRALDKSSAIEEEVFIEEQSAINFDKLEGIAFRHIARSATA